MSTNEKCINQTLLIWSGVVIVEIFAIAYLMNFPWFILACIIVYGPIKASMNWPMPANATEKVAVEETQEQ